jgi:ubiquinone biosynthesis protein UbiJ
LAKEVSEILKKIKWDVEEDLSKIIGDVAANRVGILGEKVLNESKKITISVAEAFKEYWEEEKPLIAKKTRVHQFLVEIDNISEDVERIEAKINSLALKISK